MCSHICFWPRTIQRSRCASVSLSAKDEGEQCHNIHYWKVISENSWQTYHTSYSTVTISPCICSSSWNGKNIPERNPRDKFLLYKYLKMQRPTLDSAKNYDSPECSCFSAASLTMETTPRLQYKQGPVTNYFQMLICSISALTFSPAWRSCRH